VQSYEPGTSLRPSTLTRRCTASPPSPRLITPAASSLTSCGVTWLGSGSGSEGVMLDDVRDTAFQRDPFQGLEADRFHVFAEERELRIGECGRDNGDCYGESPLQTTARN